jgi:hypothetical protein
MLRNFVPCSRVVVVLLLAVFSFAGDKRPSAPLPELNGNWRLDPVHSTAHPRYLVSNQIIIRQFGREYQFEFRAGSKLMSREIYALDGREHPGANTKLARAFVLAKLEKGQLVVITRSVMDPDGLQTFSETDHWFLSPDKKTLTHKMSDGKLCTYQKQPDQVETEETDKPEEDR